MILDAFAPSKVKKGRRKAGKSGKKKGKVIESNVEEKNAREERKIKMAEAKAKQDEEMKMLKEREEEQTRLLEEVKEKQRLLNEILFPQTILSNIRRNRLRISSSCKLKT